MNVKEKELKVFVCRDFFGTEIALERNAFRVPVPVPAEMQKKIIVGTRNAFFLAERVPKHPNFNSL